MIVDCPFCHTSNTTHDPSALADLDGAQPHDVAEDGTGPGDHTHTGAVTMVLCRGCGRRFHAPSQMSEVAAQTTQVVLGAEPDVETGDTGAKRDKPTAVVNVADLMRPEAEHSEVTGVLQRHSDSDTPTRVALIDIPPDALASPPAEPEPEREPITPSDPTVVRPRAELEEDLRLMRQQTPPPSRSSLPDSNSTPQSSAASQLEGRPLVQYWRQRLRLWRALYMEQTPAVRALILAGGLLAVAVLFLLIRAQLRPSNELAFVALPQPLLAEPGRGTVPQRMQIMLPRGVQVTIFDHVGTYAMVRDLQGRVGYLVRDGLIFDRPASQPDMPFVDCVQGAQESDSHGCETRADQQWESCRSWCEKGNGTDKCTEDCRARYSACKSSCRGETPAPEPGPGPTPGPPPASTSTRPDAPSHSETHGVKNAPHPKRSVDKRHKK